MSLSIKVSGRQAGSKLRTGLFRQQKRIAKTSKKTMQDASKEILRKGRADMKRGGNFGSSRWQSGLKAPVRLLTSGFRVDVFHKVPYFHVFEYGAVIKGKPLLWIPLSFARDAKGVMARDFPGGLFRVDRSGSKAPLLLSIADGEPKYFGKESVKIPQKFHIREIARKVANKLRQIYSKNFKGGK